MTDKQKSPHVHSAVSELRQDLVSGEWVVIATGRAARPAGFSELKSRPPAGDGCHLDNPFRPDEGKPSVIFPEETTVNKTKENWQIVVLPNKYPAFAGNICDDKWQEGPYQVMSGAGKHDLVVYRDHNLELADFSLDGFYNVLKVYQKRYLILAKEPCIRYVSILHNKGRTAGASLIHPHSQIFAIPVISPDIERSLSGSGRYYKKNNACVHCNILEWELAEKKRIIFENELAAAICPFVSRSAYEIRIFPKLHRPYFEDSDSDELKCIADVFLKSLRAVGRVLRDPDYNFFIHTSPVYDKKKYFHYHWHIEFLPKTAIPAGLELGTGIDVSTIDPEEAARKLSI